MKRLLKGAWPRINLTQSHIQRQDRWEEEVGARLYLPSTGAASAA